jgi:hypothetical protein
MTFEQAYEYAGNRGKDITAEDFDSWIEIDHEDGSELYFECCSFEFIDSNNGEDAWLVLWTQNHGYVVYPIESLLSWQGGEMTENEDGSVFLSS